MSEWDLREKVLLAILTSKGHTLIDDPARGWTICGRCGVTWWIRRRAELADEGITDISQENLSSMPMVFDSCRP